MTDLAGKPDTQPRRPLTAAERRARADPLVADWPPLTPRQLDRLALIFASARSSSARSDGIKP